MADETTGQNLEQAAAVDLRFVIHLRPGRMAADLEILAPPSGGGLGLTLDKIRQELAQRKIVFGFAEQNLELVLLELEKLAYADAPMLRLATGLAPQAGANGRIEYQVGSGADHSDPLVSNLARPGQILARRVGAEPGIPGRDVLGEEIAAKKGYDPPLTAGDHVILAEDGLTYLAEIYGRAIVAGGLIKVAPLVEIAEDGMSAWLPIYPRLADNSRLEYEHLVKSLDVAGVSYGVMAEVMQAALEQERVIPRLLVAKGEIPVDGRDAEVRFTFFLNNHDPWLVEAQRQAGTLPPGLVSKSLLKSGAVLAEKTPLQPMLPGYRVTGETVPGRTPSDISLVAGENVISDADGLVFRVADNLIAGYVDYRDGALIVSDPLRVSDDAMRALLEIHPPDKAGRGLRGELLLKILAAHRVSRGVNKEAIQRAVKFAEIHQRVLPEVLVARGQEPVNGRDSRIELLVQADKMAGRVFAQPDRIDFRERNTINSVRKGELLACRFPPEPGLDGWTVRGDGLAAKPGVDLQFQPQPNVVISEDGLSLLAGIDGAVAVLAPNKITVFQVYEVKGDVDYKVGNLEMDGTLVISGWIRPGFTVRASGDIRVEGGVEDAALIAGANVQISGGMISKGRGRIKAEADVVVRFLEWTRVYAGAKVIVHEHIMRSQIFAGSTLTVTAGKGLIRGGLSSAIKGIEANEIGSPAGIQTVVMAGDNPLLRHRLFQLNRQLTELVRQRVKMDKELGHWLAHSRDHGRASRKLPSLTQRKMSLLVKQQRALVQKENQLIRSREEMTRELADVDLAKIRIKAKKAVYAGTVVVIGRIKYEVLHDILRPVTFLLSEDGRSIICRS